jgi:simple sugar transport system permease protein
MFNFIASALMVFLVGRFFRVPGQPAVESHPFAEGLEMPALYPLLNQWGIEVPSNPLNASVVLALLACVGVWVLLWKTRLGYELRALGASPDAARYAGMSPSKLTVLAMALSGGLAAMVGVNEIAGVHHKLLLDFTAGAGFTGIAVSLMGRNHPVGIVLSALLFGALYQGGAELAFELPSFTRDMVVSIQGLVVLFSGALALMLRPTVAWLYGWWLSLKKPSTQTQEA